MQAHCESAGDGISKLQDIASIVCVKIELQEGNHLKAGDESGQLGNRAELLLSLLLPSMDIVSMCKGGQISGKTSSIRM